MTIANSTQELDRDPSEVSDRGRGLDERLALARRALLCVFAVALVGIVFSGVLTYRDYAQPEAAACTPLGEPGTILGAPPCVYGLAMYSVVALAAGWALSGPVGWRLRKARTGAMSERRV